MPLPKGPLIEPEPGHEPGFQAAAVMKVLRGLTDSVVTKGSPLEALVQQVVPGYQSEGVGPYSAETPEDYAQVAQGFAGGGITRLQKELYKKALSPQALSKLSVPAATAAIDLTMMPKAAEREALLRGGGTHGKRFSKVVQLLRDGLIEPTPEIERASTIQALRGELRSGGLDIGDEARALRSKVDKGVLIENIRRPEENVSITHDSNAPWSGRTHLGEPDLPIELNTAALANDRGWVNRVRRKARTHADIYSGITKEQPEDWPMMRGVLAHEKAERGTVEGKHFWAPFASHGGPQPLMSQLYEVGARNPEVFPVVEEQIRVTANDIGDGPQAWMAKKMREYGSTPGRPLPPQGRTARKLVEALRKEMDKRNYSPPGREETIRQAREVVAARKAAGMPTR